MMHINVIGAMEQCAGGVLRLQPHLIDVIVDDPDWEYKDTDAYGQTVGALNASAWQGGLKDLKVIKRTCVAGCRCGEQYQSVLKDEAARKRYGMQTAKLFFFMAADA